MLRRLLVVQHITTSCYTTYQHVDVVVGLQQGLLGDTVAAACGGCVCTGGVTLQDQCIGSLLLL